MSASGSSPYTAAGEEDDVVLDMNPNASRAHEEASEIADDETEIETLLSELSGAVQRIEELADPDGRGAASIQVQAALRRHREVLGGLENDYGRLHGNLRDAQAKRDLLGNVRSDIKYVELCLPQPEWKAADVDPGHTASGSRTMRHNTWPTAGGLIIQDACWMKQPRRHMLYETT